MKGSSDQESDPVPQDSSLKNEVLQDLKGLIKDEGVSEDAGALTGSEDMGPNKASKKRSKYGELLRGSQMRVKGIEDELASFQKELNVVQGRRHKRDERLAEMRELQRQYQAELKKRRELIQKQNEAATRIQRNIRGYFIRMYFRLTVASAKEHQQLQCQRMNLNVQLQGLRHCVHNLEHVEGDRVTAAVKIQAWWRGTLGRHLVRILIVYKKIEGEWEKMEYSATRVQSLARGHFARKNYKTMEQEVVEATRRRNLMEMEMNNRSVLTIQRATRGYLGRKEAMRRRDIVRRELEKEGGDVEPSSPKKLEKKGAADVHKDRHDRSVEDGSKSHRDDHKRGGDHIHWGGRENAHHKVGGPTGQGKKRDKSSDEKNKAGGTKPSKRHSTRPSKRVDGEDSESSDGGEEHSDERCRSGGGGSGDRSGSRKGRSRKSRPRKVKRGSMSGGSPDRDVRDDDHGGGPSPPPRENFETHIGGEPERSIGAVSLLAASLFDVTLQKAALELSQVAAAAPKELPALALENPEMLTPNPRYKEVAARLFEPHF